jgi:hypothetical protein
VIDITTLDYTQLSELRTKIDERLREIRENGVPELRDRFASAAAALGLSLDEVMGKPRKKRGRPPAATPEA